MSKVLVVDDEPEICELLILQLERKGHNVTSAGSGNAALKILAAEKFDLVLSDIRMPNGDGLYLLSTIRANGVDTPVVFLSGFAEIDESKAKELGAWGIISKPFDRKTLENLIESCLGKK